MKKKIKEKLKHFINKLELMKNRNMYVPFPLYDTNDIKLLEEKINKMSKKEYDEVEIECCKKCHSVYLIEDEDNKDLIWCGKCNNLTHYKNLDKVKDIFEYKKLYGDIWT